MSYGFAPSATRLFTASCGNLGEPLAWTVEVMVMGRRALPMTEVVEHQMEVWCWLDKARDKLREAYLVMDRELWEAEQELRRANELLEWKERDDDAG